MTAKDTEGQLPERWETSDEPIPDMDPHLRSSCLRQRNDKVVENLAAIVKAPKEVALQALYQHALKGSAAAKAPSNTKVSIHEFKRETKTQKVYEIKKGHVLKACEMVDPTLRLRSLFESMVDTISLYAEEHRYNDDLAEQFNTRRLAEQGGQPLTQRQRSWCNSFNQGNPSLEQDGELLVMAHLLARDYLAKFKKPKEKGQKKNKSSPRTQGASVAKAKGNNSKGSKGNKVNLI